MPLCGGASDAQPADAETIEICQTVRSELETRVGKAFEEYTAVSMRKQVVAGTNFFVKIHVGGGDHIHVRIFRPLPNQGGPSVAAHQVGKTAEDLLEYFQ